MASFSTGQPIESFDEARRQRRIAPRGRHACRLPRAEYGEVFRHHQFTSIAADAYEPPSRSAMIADDAPLRLHARVSFSLLLFISRHRFAIGAARGALTDAVTVAIIRHASASSMDDSGSFYRHHGPAHAFRFDLQEYSKAAHRRYCKARQDVIWPARFRTDSLLPLDFIFTAQ